MLVLRTRPVVINRQATVQPNAFIRWTSVALTTLIASACSVASAPLHGTNPADPDVAVPAANYRSVVGPYTRQRPVEPLPWREQNERVAPQGNR